MRMEYINYIPDLTKRTGFVTVDKEDLHTHKKTTDS